MLVKEFLIWKKTFFCTPIAMPEAVPDYQPASLPARSIGFYSRGCLAGAQALPVDGATWQVMRQSRNRNWGHPNLVLFLERLANHAPKIGWRGLLVGDMAQPRGGPMRAGHFSHQVGLDADIWLTPMPARELSRQQQRWWRRGSG